ncbi:MAG TPA: terminase family protein [Rhizomicrobium sp.]|jgi:phage terminase large subunit-like protein|nr:terminase family protein [Rhizomicrobium sp.]
MQLRDDPAILHQVAHALEADWSLHARANQLPPPGDWTIWLLLAGRGFGKTRAGAEFVKAEVEGGRARRVALVTSTAADGRDVVVEGESGLLAIGSPWCFPQYEPSKRRLTWPNGAIATLYSAEEADRLRGPQHDLLWADELAAWCDPAAWDQAMFGLRLGKRPRAVVTTTPRPVKIIRELLAREGQDVVVTRGTSYENRENLAPAFFAEIVRRYQNTRLGRQELDAEVLDDVPGALWTREWIDNARVERAPEDLTRVVVAIDPAVTSGEDADETGIVVAGVATDHAYVLADLSGRLAPHEWAARAVAAYHRHKADCIVAEVNNGGEMVEAVIRQVDPNVSFKSVHASRGKVTRAEPAAALYEQGRAHHVGMFAQLEDQMCALTSDFDRKRAGYSPDRADALVWALTTLCIEALPGMGLLRWYEQQAANPDAKPIMVPDDEPFPLPPLSEKLPTVRMRAPADWCRTVNGSNGTKYCIAAGAEANIEKDDIPAFRRFGFEEIAA